MELEKGKIFVGGLTQDTTQEDLKDYFRQYGEITDSVVMQDPVTKKPRGFGFVTFSDMEAFKDALHSGPHMINGKTVDAKAATAKGQADQASGDGKSDKKIFVGGISTDVDENELKAYFSQFGKVTSVDLKKDRNNNDRSKGFGFVEFESSEVVEKLVQTHYHQIGPKTAEVKKAEPRNAMAGAQTRGRGGDGAGAGYGAAYGGAYAGYGAAYAGYGASGYGAYPRGGQQYPPSYGSYGYPYSHQSYAGYYGHGQGGSYNHESSRDYYGSEGTRGSGHQSGYEASYGDRGQGGGSYSRGGHAQQQQQRNYY